jgi:hypothetical protein
VTDLDVLLAELRACPPETIIDRAAEALGEASEAVSALADRDDYDTVTLWWAAGTLSAAYAAILPHTSIDLPDPPSGPAQRSDDIDRVIGLLDAVAGALAHAARAAADPDLIYALASSGNLADQARRALANAPVAL